MLKNRYLFLFFFTSFSIKKALKVIISNGCLLASQLVNHLYCNYLGHTLFFFLNIGLGLMKIGVWFIMKHTVGLCSCRAWWLLAPNFCSWVTRESKIFHTNHMLCTLDFTVSKDWALFNFPHSTALYTILYLAFRIITFLAYEHCDTAWLHSLQQFLWKL